MPSALVTGASGFLGKHICSILQQAGWDIYATVRQPTTTSASSGLYQIQADITEPTFNNKLQKIVRNIDAIFHFAASIPRKGNISYRTLADVNIAGTASILDFYDKSKAEVFVYASSLPIIGLPLELPISENHPVHPLTPYHATKYAGEIMCEEFRRRTGRRVVSYRISAPYGQFMPESVLLRFILAAINERNRGRNSEWKRVYMNVYGTGARVQNFIWAKDIALACLEATKRGNGVYNLGGPSSISMLELAKLICSIAKVTTDIICVNEKEDPQELFRYYVDINRFLTEFPLSLTSIENGIKLMIKNISGDKYEN